MTTRMLFIPASRTMWADVAVALADKGLQPKVWLGDWRNYAFGRDTFPDCVTLGLKEVQGEVGTFPVRHVPDADFVTSRGFIQLKSEALKLMDRQDEVRAFGRLERDAHFFSMATRLYSLIIEHRIDVVVAAEAPHHVAQLIAFRLCELLGIATYVLVNNTYVPLVHIQRQIVGAPIPISDKADVTVHTDEVAKAFDGYRHGIPTPLYMADQAKRDRSWSFVNWALRYWKAAAQQRVREVLGKPQPFRDDVQIRSRFPFQSNRRRFTAPFIIERLRRDLERTYPRVATTVNVDDPSLGRFVYFPMPFEPERTSLPDGGDFFEAVDALLALRAYLPVDVSILVKEHPTQFSRTLPGYKARSSLIYTVLSRLPNTTLVDLSVPSSALIEHAEFTCVITGTAALESALVGRLGVTFGTPWFAGLPGISQFESLPPFDEVVAGPRFTVDEITSAARSAITECAFPGIISVEQETYFRHKFGAQIDSMVSDAETVRTIATAISADFAARS